MRRLDNFLFYKLCKKKDLNDFSEIILEECSLEEVSLKYGNEYFTCSWKRFFVVRMNILISVDDIDFSTASLKKMIWRSVEHSPFPRAQFIVLSLNNRIIIFPITEESQS